MSTSVGCWYFGNKLLPHFDAMSLVAQSPWKTSLMINYCNTSGVIYSFFQAPHCCNMRSPLKMGDAKLVDSMMLDGLIDAFHGYHMGITGNSIDHIFFPIGRYHQS